jgi:glutamate/tyrosine decarboxylase-like PLP-dependent enzyme
VGGGDNPSDLAVGLSRRARGIPLWMSLVANGTLAYAEAVDACLDLAGEAAAQISDTEYLELLEPRSLSVVVFRRRGWSAGDYEDWSRRAIADGTGLVTPTRYAGAPALRLCFVNPLTTKSDIARILVSLA